MQSVEIINLIIRNGSFETFGDPFSDERVESEMCVSLRALMSEGKIELSDKRCNDNLVFFPTLAYCRQLDKAGKGHG